MHVCHVKFRKPHLETTTQLKKIVPPGKLVICESGIRQREDIDDMLKNDVHAFLIGEALIKAEDPGRRLAEFSKQHK